MPPFRLEPNRSTNFFEFAMSSGSTPSTPRMGVQKLSPWLVIVLILGFLGFAWYQNTQRRDATERERVLAQQENGAKPAATTTRASSSEVASNDDFHDAPVVPEVMPEPGTVPSREALPSTAGSTSSKTAVPGKPLATTDRTPAPTRAGPSPTTAGRAPTANDRSTSDRTAPDPRMSPKSPTQPTNDPRRDTPKPDTVEKKSATTAQLENQTIRDFGRVVFKGTIDLQPTLDRIARGERNTHRNDGSTFGNRERRLPQKPQGYYTEYVHPTKDINGPGPQRVIFGKSGDIWYTPDHYETFKKIK